VLPQYFQCKKSAVHVMQMSKRGANNIRKASKVNHHIRNEKIDEVRNATYGVAIRCVHLDVAKVLQVVHKMHLDVQSFSMAGIDGNKQGMFLVVSDQQRNKEGSGEEESTAWCAADIRQQLITSLMYEGKDQVTVMKMDPEQMDVASALAKTMECTRTGKPGKSSRTTAMRSAIAKPVSVMESAVVASRVNAGLSPENESEISYNRNSYNQRDQSHTFSRTPKSANIFGGAFLEDLPPLTLGSPQVRVPISKAAGIPALTALTSSKAGGSPLHTPVRMPVASKEELAALMKQVAQNKVNLQPIRRATTHSELYDSAASTPSKKGSKGSKGSQGRRASMDPLMHSSFSPRVATSIKRRLSVA